MIVLSQKKLQFLKKHILLLEIYVFSCYTWKENISSAIYYNEERGLL